MQVTYVGPFYEVHVPALDIDVELGGTIDVDEGAATALLDQRENWALPTSPEAADAQARLQAHRARLAASPLASAPGTPAADTNHDDAGDAGTEDDDR